MTCALSVNEIPCSNACEETDLDDTRAHSGREPPTRPAPKLFCIHERGHPGSIPKVPCSSDETYFDALSSALHSSVLWGENPQRDARM